MFFSPEASHVFRAHGHYGDSRLVETHLDRQYAEAVARAAYYRWSIGKTPVGNDPMTGQPWKMNDPVARRVGDATNAARAWAWLNEAARIRAGVAA